jgi:hypothetical protein
VGYPAVADHGDYGWSLQLPSSSQVTSVFRERFVTVPVIPADVQSVIGWFSANHITALLGNQQVQKLPYSGRPVLEFCFSLMNPEGGCPILRPPRRRGSSG